MIALATSGLMMYHAIGAELNVALWMPQEKIKTVIDVKFLSYLIYIHKS